jgi:hypothetical protein
VGISGQINKTGMPGMQSNHASKISHFITCEKFSVINRVNSLNNANANNFQKM